MLRDDAPRSDHPADVRGDHVDEAVAERPLHAPRERAALLIQGQVPPQTNVSYRPSETVLDTAHCTPSPKRHAAPRGVSTVRVESEIIERS